MGNQAGIIIRNVKNELFHSAKRLILNEVKGIECLLMFRGTMVENHCWLSDQGVEDNSHLEDLLRKYANESLASRRVGESIWPNANFNALFLSWHASAHFMFEEISLRQVIDWALFLLKEGNEVDMEMFRKAKAEFAFGKFADIMTALALDYLRIPSETICPAFIEGVKDIESSLVDKVFQYIIIGNSIDHTQNKWRVRTSLVKNFFKDSWKYREIYAISMPKLLWHKVKRVFSEKK